MALIKDYEDSLAYLSSFSKQGAPVKDLSRFSALARELGDPHPAGRVLVVLPVAVPVELDLHPTVPVGEKLLPLRPDDDGRLAPRHDRLRRPPPAQNAAP